ncbi:hypothetical protein HPB48_004615 [Haemaphysalis longicornis]|uniref:Uncharacterized protein n=1 Tax=Haemaphysalis longicornis TaxID=44386 RepID=A0A9J6H1L8_HAELO|nr:hypothetical protein HPB48_004615 [Haemaphysalis longicornis]
METSAAPSAEITSATTTATAAAITTTPTNHTVVGFQHQTTVQASDFFTGPCPSTPLRSHHHKTTFYAKPNSEQLGAAILPRLRSSRAPTDEDLLEVGAWTDVTQRQPKKSSRANHSACCYGEEHAPCDAAAHCDSQATRTPLPLGLFATRHSPWPPQGFTASISPGAYRIRILKASNTLAIEIWQPHVIDIFLGITQIGSSTSTITLQTYETLSGGHVRGVIYGIDPNDPEEELLHNLSFRTHWIVAARRMGKKTALITFEGKRPPRYVLYYNCIMAVATHTPNSVICNLCHDIGHKADICPNSQHPRCAKCGKEHTDGISDFTGSSPQCKNCGGSHIATDPRCKKRIEANKGIRARQARRRPFSGSTHSDESRIPPNNTMC